MGEAVNRIRIAASSAGDRLASVRHPMLVILLVGIVLRAALSPLCIVYDSEYWALVIRNIDSGEGLYGVGGYYYTPVWGYILGLVAWVQDLIPGFGESAVKVTEAIVIEGMGSYFSATVPSLALLATVKLPLYVSDTILALLVWYLVRDVTGSERKAALAMALTYLSPVLLLVSGVIAMPDTVAAMFTVLTIVLLRRDRYVLAGATFCLAVLTKFFPVFMIFILVAYVLRRGGDRRVGVGNVALAAAGAVAMALVVFIPQIMEGTLAECFQFITDRTGSGEGQTLFDAVVGSLRIVSYAIVLVVALLAGRWVYRAEGDPFAMMMKACLAIAAVSLLYPPATQYIVLMVPFLAYWMSVRDRRLGAAWVLLAIGSVLCVFGSNASTLLPLAVWGGLFDVQSLVDFFVFWGSDIIGPFSLRNVQFFVGSLLQCLGIVSVLLTMYGDDLRALLRSRRGGRTRPEPDGQSGSDSNVGDRMNG